MPFLDFMGWAGPVTHRQFLVLDEWERRQWNEPSRTDWYLMQNACEAFYGGRKRPARVDAGQWRIQFRFERRPAEVDAARPDGAGAEHAARMAKARWGAFTSSDLSGLLPGQHMDAYGNVTGGAEGVGLERT